MQRIARSQLRQVIGLCTKTATRSVAAVAAPAFAPASTFSVQKRAFGSRKEAKKELALSDILSNEIDHEETNTELDQETMDVTALIEKSFKIDTEPGRSVVNLTRDFNGEHIHVAFNVQDSNEDYSDSDMYDSEEEDDEEEDEEEVQSFGIDFKASITKASKKLVVYGTATDKNINFSNISYMPTDAQDDDTTYYSGPVMDELDPALNKALIKHLNKRGLDDDMAYFIVAYSREKEQKEYVRWLKGVREFIN